MDKYIINFLVESDRQPIVIEAESFSLAVEYAIKQGKNLQFADFSNKNLFGVDFSNADLSGSSFECCRLHACNLEKSNLTGCIFSFAGLWECFASQSQWDHADVHEMALVATDISGCNFLLTRNLQTAVIGNLYGAVVPEDYDPITPC